MINEKDISKRALILIEEDRGNTLKRTWRNYGHIIMEMRDNGKVMLRDQQGRTLETYRKNVRVIDEC